MKKKQKKQWTRPVCEKVRLVPEEAVLWGCKVVWGSTGQSLLGTCINFWANCPSPTS